MSTSLTFNSNKLAGSNLESAIFPTFGGIYGT